MANVNIHLYSFNDDISVAQMIVNNERIGKDVEGSGRGVI